MAETPLDQAHLAAEADQDDVTARLRFYSLLVETELFLLLESEAQGTQITPKLFDLDDGPIILAFDSEARLTEFTGLPAPYAALSGRALVEMLAGQSMGIGLNLGVGPSSRLFPPEIIDWLAEVLTERPDELQLRADSVGAPIGVPRALLQALDQRLARMPGLAKLAYLVRVTYEGGKAGHMLAFVDALDDARGALAKAVQRALSLSGVEAGMLDVTFIASDDSRAAEFARVGLRFDLPTAPEPGAAPAPGSDPNRPPRLR